MASQHWLRIGDFRQQATTQAISIQIYAVMCFRAYWADVYIVIQNTAAVSTVMGNHAQIIAVHNTSLT